MLKKILIVVSIFFAANLSAAELKIGVVDVKLVMNKVPQIKVIKDKLQKQFKPQQDELKKLSAKVKKIQEKAQRELLTLTDDQKVNIQRELESLSNEMKFKDNYLKQDVKYAENKAQEALFKKVLKAVEQVANKENLDLVVRKEVSLFSKTSLDISNKVLAIISNPAG